MPPEHLTIQERSDAEGVVAHPVSSVGVLAIPPEVLLGYRLWQANHLWQREVGRYLKPVGLTPVQYVLLAAAYHLVSRNEAPSQIRLSTYTGIEKMMVSKNLRQLARHGYLSRTSCKRDRRIIRIRLTTAGRQILRRAFGKAAAAHESFFRVLGEDWRRLDSTLRTLIHSHID
jgi:DNA-binding MarR family transcriptional regulator